MPSRRVSRLSGSVTTRSTTSSESHPGWCLSSNDSTQGGGSESRSRQGSSKKAPPEGFLSSSRSQASATSSDYRGDDEQRPRGRRVVSDSSSERSHSPVSTADSGSSHFSGASNVHYNQAGFGLEASQPPRQPYQSQQVPLQERGSMRSSSSIEGSSVSTSETSKSSTSAQTKSSSRSKSFKGLLGALTKTAKDIRGEMQYQKPLKTSAKVAKETYQWVKNQPLPQPKTYSVGQFSYISDGKGEVQLRSLRKSFGAGYDSLKAYGVQNSRFHQIIQSHKPDIKSYAKLSLGSMYAPLKKAYVQTRSAFSSHHLSRNASWSGFSSSLEDQRASMPTQGERNQYARNGVELSQAGSFVTFSAGSVASGDTATNHQPAPSLQQQDWRGNIETWRQQAYFAASSPNNAWMNTYNNVEDDRRTI
jgi:hypothetical protein